MAQARAGEILRLKYFPNGHQRGAGQQPKNWTIHWTGVPGTQLNNRLDLNAANRLVGPSPFDEECFCNNCAGDPCYGYLPIPANTPPGTYFFVWYWVFDRVPSSGGEEYTTCFDVQVIGGTTRILPPQSENVTKIVIPVEADAFVKGGTSADTAFGSTQNACLGIRGSSTPDNSRETFLRFDTTMLKSHSSYSCELKVTQKQNSSVFSTVVAVVNDDSWYEQNITFRTKPASAKIAGEMVGNSTQLNDSIRQAAYDGKLSLRLYDSNLRDLQQTLYSKEAGNGPTLVCTIYQEESTSDDPGSQTSRTEADPESIPQGKSSDSSFLSLSALLFGVLVAVL